jgi:hypothetical protein
LPETSFAGLLATMAAPQGRQAPWNDEGLADDVASISYEQALRAHARVRPASANTESKPEALPPAAPLPAAPLKTASITIRLSETECAQLRRRAAEAGLSVSAYLRSCTLEVESLRAQVKQTLSELRSSAPKPHDHEARAESTGGIRDLLARIWHWCQLIGRRRQPALLLNPANPFAPLRS